MRDDYMRIGLTIIEHKIQRYFFSRLRTLAPSDTSKRQSTPWTASLLFLSPPLCCIPQNSAPSMSIFTAFKPFACYAIKSKTPAASTPPRGSLLLRGHRPCTYITLSLLGTAVVFLGGDVSNFSTVMDSTGKGLRDVLTDSDGDNVFLFFFFQLKR